jgi:hypothetical protein
MSNGPSRMGKIRDVYARRHLPAIAARWDARADSWDRELQDPEC